MRHLYLLRGVPGVGKSTLIQEYGLEPFTLSADKIRQQYSNTDYKITYDEEGNASVKETIASRQESKVWDILLDMLDARMSRGETTIIDATHSNTKLLRNYNKLVDKYRYRIFTIQLDCPLEEIIKRNNNRHESQRVDEQVVIKKFHDVRKSTPNIAKKYNLHRFDNIQDAGNFIYENSTWRAKKIDPEQYKKVYVIGDIHASYEVFKDFLDEYYREDNYYVFLGDYLDRGLNPYGTVKELHKLHNQPNVVMLRGNHETNYENWLATPKKYTEEHIQSARLSDKKVKEQLKEIKLRKRLTRSSTRYIKELQGKVTQEEFEDFTLKLKQIMMRVQDIFLFTVNDQTYVCTHGGIVQNVLDYRETGSMINFSADSMIRGVGSYSDDIDKIFTQQMLTLPKEERMIQIHGHRNQHNKSLMEEGYSYNLEQFISDGGDLGVVEIDTQTGDTQPLTFKNNHYRMTLQNTALNDYPIEKFYEDAKKDNYLRVKELTTVEDVYSINFTEKAFYEKEWNHMTVQARGLFVNPLKGTVVARSYNKFFNLNERATTRLKKLEENFTLPVTVSSKVNGFLGILTVYEGEFLFLSKSTDGSRFSQLFKDTFLDHAEKLNIHLEELKQYIQANNVSLVFEVVDNEKDPHIIKYENKGVVLLDVFKNQLEEETLDKNNIPELSKFIMPEEKVFSDFDELKRYINNFNHNINMRTSPTLTNVGESLNQYNEGFVMTDADNNRIKVKGAYYNTWKEVRPILWQRLAGKRGNANNRIAQEFLDYATTHRRFTITGNLLVEREGFAQYIKQIT